MKEKRLYGLLAEFDDADRLVLVARKAYEGGYRKMDAYTPFPVKGIQEAIGFRRRWVAPIVLAAGIIGGLGGFFMQCDAAIFAYPINVGGRPLFSWPSFIPITFELTILTASSFAILGLLALCGLPMPYHPVFNVPSFQLASRDRFFLAIFARDPRFDREATRSFLQDAGAKEVSDIER